MTPEDHVVHPYNGMLFGLEKGRNSDTAATWMNLEGIVPREICL